MAVVGNYFTSASPQAIAELTVQSETRVRVGTTRLYVGGSLDTTSALYTAYGASIGVVAGNSFDLGELASLGFEHVPTFEKPDVANVIESSLDVLSEEETTISMGVMQFDPRLLEIAVGTGTLYTIGNERLITVGGKCTVTRRPIELSAENIGCNAPSAPVDTLTGISLIVITAYDCAFTSGLPWSDILANEISVLDLEASVFPVRTKVSGNYLFNIYIC